MRDEGLRSPEAMRAGGDAFRSERRLEPTGFRGDVPGHGGRPLWTGDAWRGGGLPAPGLALADAGALPGGGQRASGRGRADGGAVGATGSGGGTEGPRFDGPVAKGGYVWWYVDALSADGRQGLTIIAFIGSVFSPYYTWDGQQDPYDHCAVNVVLYGERANRFAMTERRKSQLFRDATSIAIGPSHLAWDGSQLTIRIDERAAPIPRSIRGTITVRPNGLTRTPFTLDTHGQHRWWPLAPSSRIDVTLENPALSWSGTGYFDTNDGDRPLGESFARWSWCRADLRDGAAILYDVERRDGSGQNLSLHFAPDGSRRDIRLPLAAAVPPTRLWRIPRPTRSDDGRAEVLRTFEDTPFYARSLLSATLAGEAVRPVHESLVLDRFANPLVRLMLPFRMPRPWVRSTVSREERLRRTEAVTPLPSS